MTTWLSRNTVPIIVVVLAAAVVIGASEVIDALVGAESTAPQAGDEAVAMEGVASLAGLIKVAFFIGIGAAIAVPLRRRFHPAASS